MTPKALPVRPQSRAPRRVATQPAVPGASAQSEPETLSEQLEKLFAQFGPGAEGYKVRVERKNLRGQGEYLGTIDFTLDLEDDVKSKWGGGDYAGRVVDPNSAYVRRIHCLIAGPPRPVLLVDDGPAPVPRAAESATDRVLQSIAETQRHIVDTLKEMQRGPQVNPIEQVTAVAKALKDVAGAPAPGTTPLDALALVDRVLSLREKIVGDNGGVGGGSSELGEVVKYGVAPLVQMGRDYLAFRREESKRAALSSTSTAGAVPAESATVTDPVAVIASRIPPMARAFLLKKAVAGANPEMYAEVALDQLSGEDQDALQTLLAESPDFAERFIAAIPAFGAQREWFVNWVDAMRGLLSQTDDGGAEGGNGEASAPRVAPQTQSPQVGTGVPA